MALSDAQLVTLKAAIYAETDPVIVAARPDTGVRHDAAILSFYNAEASPAVKMWRDDIAQTEIVEATIDQIGAFDTLTAGKRDAWSYMTALATLDFNRNKVRSAVGKCWANAERDAILNAVGVRNARRCELLFGTSDVSEGSVTAKKCTFIGSLTIMDVSLAMNLP